jgi:hypothetical protein
MEYNVEIFEFIDQVNFALSLEFKNKYRHRFSTHFIELFQEKLLKAFEYRKPIKSKDLVKFFTQTHKYSSNVVEDFFEAIDVSLYCPLIYT